VGRRRLFVAGYTGVLLAVSNQPVGATPGCAVFLASGLTGSAALLGWLVHRQPAADQHRRSSGWSASSWWSRSLVVVFVVLLVRRGSCPALRSRG
jgi:hypothetical protein